MRKLLAISSTYPANNLEKVPRFVKDQLVAFHEQLPDLEIAVLAPHNQASRAMKYPRESNNITEHRFHYFIPSFERLTDRGIMPALSVNKLNYLLIPFLMIAELIALFKLTKNFKPELIYAHWFTPQAINAYIVSRLTNTPFAFTTHASDVDIWRRFGTAGKMFVTRVSTGASAITSVSHRTNNKLLSLVAGKRRTLIKEKTSIIPMGIHYLENSIDNQDSNTILFIGRLTEKKGLQYAIPALKNLSKSLPGLKLKIAGDGELMNGLKDQANHLAVSDSIEFLGFTSGEKKDVLLQSSEVMIVPSIVTDSGDAEGMPVSLMEGLAHGMICIATDVSGGDEIISDGINGILIKQKSTESIEQAILRVAKMTPSEKKAIKEAALSTAAQLDWSTISKKYLDWLSSAVGK